jgi:hypothetical protein
MSMAEPEDLQWEASTSVFQASSAQFGSYTALLWQVPALSLTAQAFLLTIALDPSRARLARLLTSVLSSFVAIMSMLLMRSHRIHARNQGHVAARFAERLLSRAGIPEELQSSGEFSSAVGVWTAVNRGNYWVWQAGLLAFAIVSAGIFFMLLANLNWLGRSLLR